MKKIYLAGGCFWGTEKYISLIPGVIETHVGYANGHTEDPSYGEVCHNNTGHAETVEVLYDPGKLDLAFMLEQFFEVIDPTTLNRQGNDVGSQYRTGIYYIDESDRDVIQKSLVALGNRTRFPVVVEAMPLKNFYRAEEYHQKYLDKNPTGYCHIGAEAFGKLQERLGAAGVRGGVGDHQGSARDTAHDTAGDIEENKMTINQ
ncbi:MAG: peptide-methionine (S)-S-oxide reductase MsrA [Oscillospiraceae bacterium]|nr:peptide-methionine (S)-S-oxide reductase MsrA [Oscillospiraceae bacterium]